MSYAKRLPDGLLLTLKAQPGARKTLLDGFAETPDGPVIKLKVQAPPEEGRANEAVLRLLAEILGVKKGDLELIAGATSRQKKIEVAGDPALLAERLTQALASVDGGRKKGAFRRPFQNPPGIVARPEKVKKE